MGSGIVNIVLDRLRLSADDVRRLARAARPLTPEEVRRASLRLVRKGRSGRAGLPAYVVDTMYADCCRLNSLAKCGAMHGRTRQAMWDIFTSHGKKLRQRRFHRKVTYKFQTYTPSAKDGYLRRTDGDRQLLHHVIWEEHNGPLPAGYQLKFVNEDIEDVRIENLVAMPALAVLEQVRPADGRNQFTPRGLLKPRRRLRRPMLQTAHC